MNFLAGVLILIACCYGGYGIDNFYKCKLTTIKDFLSFINFTLTEISYLKTSMPNVIEKYHKNYPSKLSKALKTIENPQTADNQSININFLSENEKTLILSFIRDITRLDMAGHKAYIEDYKHKVNKITQELEKDMRTKGNLAKKLAPLLGLGIMIVIL